MFRIDEAMVRTLHIITWLAHGGAERQLTNVASMSPDESAIFSIKEPSQIATELQEVRVPVYSGNARSITSPKWVLRLRQVIGEMEPDVIMGWMYHGNLAASFARIIGYQIPILWNVRHSVHNLALEKPTTRIAIRSGRWCRRTPERIVYNSNVAAEQHEELGFPADKRLVIANGFDLDRFRPDLSSRDLRRAEFGIPKDQLLIGMLGRVHSMKNHLGWLQAFQEVRRKYGSVHCVIAGADVAERNGRVAKAVREAELENAVTLLPHTHLPEQLYPALDLLVMPSLGEGFPNVVGEAMACGVPTLVTDVGDSATVVDDTGFVAANGSPAELTRRTLEALALGPEGLASYGQRACKRMRDYYGLDSITSRYRDLLRSTAYNPR